MTIRVKIMEVMIIMKCVKFVIGVYLMFMSPLFTWSYFP